jgi:hypothetical protein
LLSAWFRPAVPTHNIFTALKRLDLPAELLTARPKRLRFLILNTPGELISPRSPDDPAIGANGESL